MRLDAEEDRMAWRAQVSELRSRLNAPIASREDVLYLLLGPLDLLGLIPEGLSDAERIHAQWLRLKLGKAPRTETALHNLTWIEDTQDAIVNVVLPDWSATLGATLTRLILQQWFAPRGEGVGETCGHILASALATLTKQLSRLSRSDPTARPEHRILLAEALACYLDDASVSALAKSCASKDDRPSFKWQDACRQIVSLSTRIANVFGAGAKDQLEVRSVNRWALLQLENLVWEGFNASVTSTLLHRIVQAGMLTNQLEWTEQPSGGVSDLLRAVGQRIVKDRFPSDYARSWQTTVGSLPGEEEQQSFYRSLLSRIDAECLIKKHMGVLVSPTEALHPGAEGTSFLSAGTWSTSLIIAQTLSLFLIGEEQDSSDEHIALIVSRLLSQRKPNPFSPTLVRLLVHLLQTFDERFETSTDLLRMSLKTWSTSSTKSTLDEEVSSATLIGLLIAAAPEKSEVLQGLATSADFLNGVHVHLEHLSPTVRRLGMLLAEVAAGRSGKNLGFPRKIWDGRGEGREEARVLRAALLSFPQRESTTSLNKETYFKALQLQALDLSRLQVKQIEPVHKQPRAPPKTRKLRQRASAKESTSSNSLTVDDQPSLPLLTNIAGTQNRKSSITAISDGEASSSCSSTESDSSDDEKLKAATGLSQGAAEEGKAFGMGVPGSKNKLKAPIYVRELGPLLRKNERDSVRMALRHGVDLVERKVGWGGEVDENAVEVCMALCALQNNFGIAQLEERRLSMLSVLAYASPQHVAPCLIEQYFVYQYSMAQRIAMLNALAFAATRLATGERVMERQKNVTLMANDVGVSAIRRARKEGDARMPEIQRDKALTVKPGRTDLTFSSDLLTPNKAENAFLKVALSSFIFPLIARMWKHMQNGNGASVQYGRGIVDMPFMIGALLDTLAVLCYNAQNEPRFRSKVVPEAVELVFAITRPYLAHAANHRETLADEKEEGGGRTTVLASASSLALILLDACWQIDFAGSLLRHEAQPVAQLQHWASALFEVAEEGAGGDVSRLARTSAALLLRINEINQHKIERQSRLMSR